MHVARSRGQIESHPRKGGMRSLSQRSLWARPANCAAPTYIAQLGLVAQVVGEAGRGGHIPRLSVSAPERIWAVAIHRN